MTPDGLKTALKWGSRGHRQVHDAVSARLRLSQQDMSGRYAQMAINEERFQAYIPESENDAIRRQQREQSGVPSYRTLEIPYSYAVLMTAHTYYSSVFLSRNPIFQVAGRHGETEMQIQSVEALLDYQKQVGEMLVPLYIWLLDPGKYGFGVISHYWDENYIQCRKVVSEPVSFLGLPLLGKTRQVEHVEEIPGYRGNKIFNVRPQDFFPDTRVALRYFQKGEFCARYVENSWFEVLKGERNGKYFNIDVLRKQRQEREGQSDILIARDSGSSRVTDLPDAGQTETDGSYSVPTGFIKSYEVYIKLIPQEWKFGTETKEEIWVITISSNGIVYGCEPLGAYHGSFPFDVIEHEPEGYSLFSRSMLEICQPMADIITWLVNSHFYNVRAALNNQLIVDPSMMHMKDFENPDPGKLIRLKPQAYGRDIRTMVHQLAIADVTKSHIGDVQQVVDFIQRVLGVNEGMMGALPPKSHTTATASRTSTQFGISRMKTNCEYYSAMGWTPFTQKLIQNSQQHMDFQLKLRLIGDLAMFSEPYADVSPAAISGFFDFVPVDGTLPVDRFAQANLWQMLLGQIVKVPGVAMQYDFGKIFAWVATLAGIKNIAQFRLQPDDVLTRQAQAGNVVPLSQAATPKGNPNEPRQIPGMGATG